VWRRSGRAGLLAGPGAGRYHRRLDSRRAQSGETADVRRQHRGTGHADARDGSLDLEALGRLVEFHVEAGTDGIVISGTTGESPCLSAAELDTLLRAALEAAAGRLAIIGGSGSNSTARTLELTAVVRDAGAAAALVVTPYYNKPTQQGCTCTTRRWPRPPGCR
jgi:hypothetical protein